MTDKMTFEKLEADWLEWQTMDNGHSDARQAIFDRSPQLDTADYEENEGDRLGCCIVCGCIMLPFRNDV